MDRTDWNDVPLPSRKELTNAIKAARFAQDNAGALSREEQIELLEGARWALHHLPEDSDFLDLLTQNPMSQVYFRAGLLACREYMARFVEQGGDATTAQSIRANWWPRLGDDPGPPRLFSFDEVAEEIESADGKFAIKSKDVPISVEALPRALGFLNGHMWQSNDEVASDAEGAHPHAR